MFSKPFMYMITFNHYNSTVRPRVCPILQLRTPAQAITGLSKGHPVCSISHQGSTSGMQKVVALLMRPLTPVRRADAGPVSNKETEAPRSEVPS